MKFDDELNFSKYSLSGLVVQYSICKTCCITLFELFGKLIVKLKINWEFYFSLFSSPRLLCKRLQTRVSAVQPTFHHTSAVEHNLLMGCQRFSNFFAEAVLWKKPSNNGKS